MNGSISIHWTCKRSVGTKIKDGDAWLFRPPVARNLSFGLLRRLSQSHYPIPIPMPMPMPMPSKNPCWVTEIELASNVNDVSDANALMRDATQIPKAKRQTLKVWPWRRWRGRNNRPSVRPSIHPSICLSFHQAVWTWGLAGWILLAGIRPCWLDFFGGKI